MEKNKVLVVTAAILYAGAMIGGNLLLARRQRKLKKEIQEMKEG